MVLFIWYLVLNTVPTHKSDIFVRSKMVSLFWVSVTIWMIFTTWVIEGFRIEGFREGIDSSIRIGLSVNQLLISLKLIIFEKSFSDQYFSGTEDRDYLVSRTSSPKLWELCKGSLAHIIYRLCLFRDY